MPILLVMPSNQAYYGAKLMARVSTFKWLKVETVSTFNWIKVDTVSTFNLLKGETVSTFNWLKVVTVSTFKHFPGGQSAAKTFFSRLFEKRQQILGS